MRVLWLSPWLRPLARVQAEALARRGHEVLLVTSDQHPESDTARPYELVLVPSPKRPGSWPPLRAARARVRALGAEVVVSELVRDPRWIALAGRTPRVTVVHDDEPHDPRELRPRWERALFDRWAAGSALTVTHSSYVAEQLHRRGTASRIVPLTSDLDDAALPPFATAAERRDVVLLGRLGPYKNLDVTLAAWRAHTQGPEWTGDELLLIGGGEVPQLLPAHVRHVAGRYRYRDVTAVLARAKASLVHYRQASQSGVQVLSLQLGVTPIVSPAGGLGEYQPQGEPAIGVGDVDGLTAAFDTLADASSAARRGAHARAHYRTRYAADVVAGVWEQVLADALR